MGGPRKNEKKLSWTYRNKKRQARNKREEDGTNENVQVQNKKARIVIRNLSFKVTESDIKKLYEPFGTIEQIDLLKRPDGKPIGCGFIQFKRVEDASKAIFNTNKKELLGRPINTTWAIPKSKYAEQITNKPVKVDSFNGKLDQSINVEECDRGNMERLDDQQHVETENISKVTSLGKEKKSVSRRADRKVTKLLKTKKRARIVVRNLAFQVTEGALKEHFETYGKIEEVKILTRPDGKPLGCGFVQFQLVQDAAKAIHYANMKPFLGRSIVVDRALPKTKFQQDTKVTNVKPQTEEIKIEEKVEDDSSQEDDTSKDGELDNIDDVKEEPSSSDENSDVSIKSEEDGIKIENDGGSVNEEKSTRPRVISNDVNEGKTVFLKNVPFAVTNEELKQCMEQFGPVYYALVCMDPLTEHSKGTAFVKFRVTISATPANIEVEDAEKCLSAGTELRLHDQVLDPHRALGRNEVQDTKGIKGEKIKDSRNLYLVKEGVILANSPSAVGLSATDMAKRLQMEQWKSQMLRNLNMFVSRVRLVVHNLPPTLTDAQLRQIFKKHAGPTAVIQEARIMRDLKNVDEKGVGKSKEFAFVAFTSHEDALKALRSINNNPNIFSKTKRPIVAFSIENRVMVNAKKRRIIKSREHNPLWNKDKSGVKEDEQPRKRARGINTQDSVEDHDYSGVKSKPGDLKMRSKFNLKNQALLHNKVRKTEKKQLKEQRQLQAKKRDIRATRKDVKPRQGSKKRSADEANFNKLVDTYKSKLQAIPTTKSKWYDT